MTHPTNDTGSSGPGRTSVLDGLAALFGVDRQSVARERANAAIAAELAGSRGTHAAPMDTGRRIDNYYRQNGRQELTPRQLRRVGRKVLRAEVRAA